MVAADALSRWRPGPAEVALGADLRATRVPPQVGERRQLGRPIVLIVPGELRDLGP